MNDQDFRLRERAMNMYCPCYELGLPLLCAKDGLWDDWHGQCTKAYICYEKLILEEESNNE